jgi:glycosyltransferase involved in cell wall biosynthesis
VPVVATRTGALADLDGDVALVAPGDVEALAVAARAAASDPARRAAAVAAARRRAAPEVVAPRLAALYDALAPRA